jgi:hypothetical protein
VRAVTREVAVIETAAIDLPSGDGLPLMRFHAGSDLNRDFGNWYEPNIEAIEALAIAAGFSKTEVVQGPPPFRTLRRIVRPGRPPELRHLQEYRAIVHAFV